DGLDRRSGAGAPRGRADQVGHGRDQHAVHGVPRHPVRRLQAVGLRPRVGGRDARPLPRDEVGRDLYRLAADEPVPALVVSRYRSAVLAAGTFAQTSYSAIWFGVAVMAPALRTNYHLSLGQTGLLISVSLLGSVVSLIPWGIATDRAGERIVLVT